MMNVCSSFGGTPVVFIRWNPDKFKKNDVVQVVPEEKRLKTLEGWIRHFMDPNTFVQDLLSVMYLFYDDKNTDLEVIWKYDGASSSVD
jgi:hypothetical protein